MKEVVAHTAFKVVGNVSDATPDIRIYRNKAGLLAHSLNATTAFPNIKFSGTGSSLLHTVAGTAPISPCGEGHSLLIQMADVNQLMEP